MQKDKRADATAAVLAGVVQRHFVVVVFAGLETAK
jgi:hypothetical protein